MMWPHLVFRRERMAEENDPIYKVISLGLGAILFLGGALHVLLFAQRVSYAPLFDRTLERGEIVRVIRLLDRTGAAYIVRAGEVLVPRAVRTSCRARAEREVAAAAAADAARTAAAATGGSLDGSEADGWDGVSGSLALGGGWPR
ncbi:MAG: hypothetical protein HZA54_04355 [Planctomycetes bacterium]|nr:hypothetical protein [Planctomycetota bacterium]